MKILSYYLSDLESLLESDINLESKLYPISKHRVISQIHNPRADNNDLVLIVLKKNNSIIGYRGILPDYIYIDSSPIKIGWLSTWWVDPKYRGQGIGKDLLIAAYEAYGGFVASSASTKAAKRVYHSDEKFEYPVTLTGCKFILKKLPVLVPDNYRRYKRWLNNGIIWVQNYIHQQQYQNWYDQKILGGDQIHSEVLSYIDNEAEEFVQHLGREDLSRRRGEEFNWVKEYPWVLSSPLSDMAARKYYFSSVSARYELFFYKLYKKTELIGFIVLKLRNSELSVPYAYFQNEYITEICHFLLKFCYRGRVSSLTIFYDRVVTEMCKFKNLFQGWEKVNNEFITSKVLKKVGLSKGMFHPGDGDNIFT